MAVDDLAQLIAANRAKGGRHSPLYCWMRTRHDSLAAAIEADGASWPTIAAMLAKAGLADGAGKPPTPERARKCWHQVRKDVAAGRVKAEVKRKPIVSVQIAAATPLPSPTPADLWRRTLGQAGAATVSAAPDTSALAASTTVEERLRAFRASLNEGKVRIPEPINPAKSRGKTDGET